jgi:hypothetical protein
LTDFTSAKLINVGFAIFFSDDNIISNGVPFNAANAI